MKNIYSEDCRSVYTSALLTQWVILVFLIFYGNTYFIYFKATCPLTKDRPTRPKTGPQTKRPNPLRKMGDPKSPKYKQIKLVLLKDDPKSPRYLKKGRPQESQKHSKLNHKRTTQRVLGASKLKNGRPKESKIRLK